MLTTNEKESGLSCLQSACIKGDIETVTAILNCSPDKLDSAIALSVKIGRNSSHFPGKSIFFVLKSQDSDRHKRISGLVENVTEHFKSQSLLHVAAKEENTEHLRRLLDAVEHVDCVLLDRASKRETPLMLASRFNEAEIVEFLVQRGASLELEDGQHFIALHYAVMGGKIRNITLLIELGANVLKRGIGGDSVLHLAAQNGHMEAIRPLLEHGVSVQRYTEGTTPLMLAAGNGHLETIKLLLKNGASLHSRDDKDLWTPLHYAAVKNQTDVVKFLLQNGVDLFAQGGWNETVLHLATRLELVRFLVDQGADIHARSDRRTPLHVAAGEGQSDAVAYLLTQGADINSRDECGHIALFDAVQGSHSAVAKVLVDGRCEVKLKDEEGKFLDDVVLTLAAKRGLIDVFKLLLARGVTVNTIGRHGKKSLTETAGAGQSDMVAFLLDQGANINVIDATKREVGKGGSASHEDSDFEYGSDKDDSGPNTTPLYCALNAGLGEVAKLLIERGADTSNLDGGPNSLAKLAAMHGLSDIFQLLVDNKPFHFDEVKDGGTLLSSAATRGDFHSVKFLLQKFADVNAKNITGNTALCCILQSSEPPHVVMEIVMLLLSFGANIHTRNNERETPLVLAAQKNFEKVVELLLEYGCEAKVKCVSLYTPLHHAARNNNGKVIAMLLQYGADANVQEQYHQMTPLFSAAELNRIHAVKALLEYGVDAEIADKLGRTPLAVAAERVSLPMVQALLQRESNVHIKDRFGKTPLRCAVESLEHAEKRVNPFL